MEEKLVYMTEEQIAERKAKVAAIEGLAELRAAVKEWAHYLNARAAFERGEIGIKAVPAYDHSKVEALAKKYPRAAAYLEAEKWIYSANPVKVRLAARALEKILDGEDPEAVIQEMSHSHDAFYLAQEG